MAPRGFMDVYLWLRSLGVRERDILRAIRLARRSVILRLGRWEAVVLVPSQRLGVLPPRRPVAHLDLAALLAGGHAVATVEVGRLPVEEQWYPVRVARGSAHCPCPASRLGGDPLCVHKLAAAVRLYMLGRLDLLDWLPRVVEEKKRGRATRRKW